MGTRESELDTLRERADYFGLDKEKDFDDFKVKYLNSVEKIGKRGTILPMNLQLFANIPEEKFTKYALDPTKSPDKAKAFQSALGYNKSNYNKLIENIKNNIDENKFVKKGDKGHGMLYEYVMELKGREWEKSKRDDCLD